MKTANAAAALVGYTILAAAAAFYVGYKAGLLPSD